MPYPDELIYSLVARAGIRSAITSSKQLLSEVFGDRKVIATIDLPSHLSSISELLVNTGRFDVQQLIYEHTMFPIYAPFIDESIRLRAMKRMEHCSKGSVHLMLGAPASIVKASDNFRVCPACVAKNMGQVIGRDCGSCHLYHTALSMDFCANRQPHTIIVGTRTMHVVEYNASPFYVTTRI
ncbi:TPA: TniQ family protein [Proteus mirabilis]|nr:TniQ family protein [Proteus mirabilis]HEJ9668542.1 TniQ family protein [Proteus mirabilis]HEK0445922.1 TniQ family protein [Proteus mirabilis]HEK0524806.1 TniQ family protein [Proteus mirabilis]HEK0769490.1 TniQ family protein [Proteus mirabilis]